MYYGEHHQSSRSLQQSHLSERLERMAVSERILAVLIGIILVPKCDADLGPTRSGLEEGLPENVLMPNERESLDDCHLRFYHAGDRGIVGPAFAKPAFLTEFAHIAAIGWSRADGKIDWSCGGSLIWNNFILTAAHCASDEDNIEPDVARMGDLNLFSAEDDAHAQQLKIVKIIRHPQHTFSAKYHDITLMQLEQNVTIHETVAPSCLWLDDEVRFRDLESAGWGQTGFAEERTPILLKVTLNPLRNEHCSDHYTSGNVRGLRQGLASHQLCAGDDKMDTCLGDSGGPLHVRLQHNHKVTPFLVGVTSFGKPCGQSHPGVYTRVSSFRRWIIETLQTNGAPEVTDEQFEPYACALRYVHIRQLAVSRVVANESGVFETFDFTREYITRDFVKEAVELRWQNASNAPSNCMGVIIDHDTIVTLGDCASHEGALPTQVIHRIRTGYLEDDFAERAYDVKEVVVHPNHTVGSYYDNLAVVKIGGAFGITPSCIWNALRLPDQEMEITTVGRRDLNEYQYESVTNYDSRLMRLLPRVYGYENNNCSLADQYRNNLSRGLQNEHLCFGNDPFLVPQTCDLTNGGPLQRSLFRLGRHFKHVYALSLFGRDCGFGEPAVAVRLHSHLSWLESVLLPKRCNRTNDDEADDDTKSDSILFIDSELELLDRCDFHDGSVGLCVPADRCRGVYDRMQRHETALFCTNGSIICCLPRNILDDSDLRYGVGEIESCARSNGDLRDYLATLPKEKRPKTHIAEVGWFDTKADKGAIVCLGYLITTQAVLTTAECTTLPGPKLNIVRLGAIQGQFEDSSEITEIGEIIMHPRYEEHTKANNIALLKLANYMRPTRAIFPGCLWPNATHTPLESTHISMVAKGVLERALHPQYAFDCERALGGELSEGQMCMQITEGAVCGNSGDPVVWSEKTVNGSASVEYLVGLYSHANCTVGSPGVIVRISAYRKWIQDVL